MPPEPDNYMYALKDKHTRLTSLDGPKLIIIGGSNTAFGIDSELMKKKLGLPVINMGIHVGLRLEYMLNEIKPDIRHGDIILLLPEYSHFFYKVEAGFTKAFFRANEVYPEAMKFIKPDDFVSSLAQTYTELLQTKIKTLLISTGVEQSKHVIRNKLVYRRESFNQYGDMIAHLDMKAQEFERNDDTFKQFEGLTISEKYLSLTNAFDQYATEHGATFMLSFAPTPNSVFLKEVGEKMLEYLKSEASYTILGSPEDFVYSDSLFFDTRYHLIKESREDRTEKLIRYIKNSSYDFRQ